MKRYIFFMMMFLSNALVYGKQLTIGISITPPFAFYSGSNEQFFGFTVELMDNICKQMDAECTYKPLPINSGLNEVQNGTVDLAFPLIPITKDNTGQFLFSLPYLISDAQFVAQSNSPINTIADVKGKKIGVLSATLNQILNNSQFDESKIKLYTDFGELVDGLNNHKIDVIFINDHVAQYMLNNAVVKMKLIGSKISVGEGYGILGLKSNKHLIEKVNTALLKIENDGTYLKIYEVYFGDSN